jgi:hypothetical protein
MTTRMRIVVLLLAVGTVILGYRVNRLDRIVHDQAAYIDGGCVGRYQGEAP